MKGSLSPCGEECEAQKSLKKIRETILNCGWEHIRGCKWCGNLFVEWEGLDCDGCELFICDECNKRYGSHRMVKEENDYFCRDCTYRCSFKGCEAISRKHTPKIQMCKKGCGCFHCEEHEGCAPSNLWLEETNKIEGLLECLFTTKSSLPFFKYLF